MASERIPAQRFGLNLDCGLKTRQWPGVTSALNNMVQALKN
ncbi:hypothetical protein [Paraglaciecola polaris]|uniref:Cobalamin-independent methionine synthase MetE C-terminal/archaeal domain-containing protein n=1 Tax=Paraglaciecola polaris LMG 21857 TaxID=1129793 RepID=K7AAP0_9ALTE|nr:hypothetical protein GPLA_1536 [Paraglaciecola polaris LMG 21857]